MPERLIDMNSIFSNLIRKIIRFLIAFLFAIGSMALGGYLAFFAYQTVFAVSTVQTPSIIEMDIDSARQNLYKAGLKMVINNELVFQQDEKYIVVSQKPSAGTKIKKNRTVEVEISATNSLHQIPDLIGRTISRRKITFRIWLSN